uniref:RNA cytidine acetyltransferase n=1 Tax=Syphacia muris TaxID=451379 RepID=A0A0N5ADA8_9BILA
MVRTKLDNRIRILIENGVASGHRSMFVIVGDKGRDQVVILHHILSKATVAARPSVLWCYRKELDFSTHRKKRMKELKKRMKSNSFEDDPFDMFISSTNIRYCYYSETYKILGNTFGMLVLQDFEALTPNLLARTIETVEGGGIIVFLLKTVSSLKQLYTMTMDVHKRFRTESHAEIVPRFNERFILSLASCRDCAVVDDHLNILPLSSHIAKIEAIPANMKANDVNETTENMEELASLKESMTESKSIGVLLKECRTLCQAKAFLRMLDVITEQSLQATCSITAARGRGKSAALGLAIAGAIGFGYSNIFVTSPAPENLKTLFEFVIRGLKAMDYEEHTDFELLQSTKPELNKALVRINVFKGQRMLNGNHRQTVQYIDPRDSLKISQAELVVIDEAAAIPLPLVKDLISGPHLSFLSSTINGYEGTGRSLSLKLLQQLREQASGIMKDDKMGQVVVGAKSRKLFELSLEESIRYKPGDQIESWLNRVLCLSASNTQRIISRLPPPKDCELLYVNRDTLFSFHKASESFLHNLMSIYASAHYKNTPNDLQMLSDAPAHHLFVLVGPITDTQVTLPEVLVVIQICIEGALSPSTVLGYTERGRRAAGDLVPWTINQQFMDTEFTALTGARVVRIAVHPDFQSMGYGTRALQLLQEYYEGNVPCVMETDDRIGHSKTQVIKDPESVVLLEEVVVPRSELPPLLLRLNERKAEYVDYLSVSYGLTQSLLKFWKRAGFVPAYLRQTCNDLTGEHSCIMLKALHQDSVDNNMQQPEQNIKLLWLSDYFAKFRRRVLELYGYEFSKFPATLALSILELKNASVLSHLKRKIITREELGFCFLDNDLKRLSSYASNMVDYHIIVDLLPTVARLYFDERFSETVKLKSIESAILLGLGLQHKSVDTMVKELDLPSNQLLALFNKAIRRISAYFDEICKDAIRQQMEDNDSSRHKNAADHAQDMERMPISLEEELQDAANEVKKKQEEERNALREEIARNFEQYTIKGSEDDWANALKDVDLHTVKKGSGLLSVKSAKSKRFVNLMYFCKKLFLTLSSKPYSCTFHRNQHEDSDLNPEPKRIKRGKKGKNV